MLCVRCAWQQQLAKQVLRGKQHSRENKSSSSAKAPPGLFGRIPASAGMSLALAVHSGLSGSTYSEPAHGSVVN
eukprot:7629121-Alexandrium_andersonii.AAC.1